MRKIIFLIFLITFVYSSYSTDNGWKHITTLPTNERPGVEKQILISPDYILCYIYTNNVYLSTDQGKTWDSVAKLNNNLFELAYTSPEYQYYFYHKDNFSGYPGSKKVIIKVSSDYKKSEMIHFIDTSSNIANISSPYMLDTNTGFFTGYEIINKNLPIENNNIIYFMTVTFDGWKTFERREIPLYFWSSGYAFNQIDKDNIICSSIGNYTHIKGKDTVRRAGMIANYNFYKDEWTLLYEFPNRPPGYEGPFTLGPSNFQMVNDSVGYGIDSRQISYHIDSNYKYYDVVYRTRDRCRTFEKIMDTFRIDLPYDIQNMRFYDEKNGVIVGRYGKVLMTNDGGETWKLEDPEQFKKPNEQFVLFVDWAGQFPVIGTRLNARIFRYEGDFFKFDFKAPDLFFPRKDAVAQNTDILFRWEELRDAGAYKYELSDNPEFTNVIYSQTTKKMNLQRNNLGFFKEYWWRVYSFKGSETKISKTGYFRTKMRDIMTESPDCTTLETPDSVTFGWYPVTGAEHYRLRLSDKKTFGSIIVETDTITQTSFQLRNLQYEKTYYWQVQAYRSDESGSWSDICTFTVQKDPNTGVSYEAETELMISPNPAGDFIEIQPSEGLKPSEGYKVQIFNMLGIEIISTPSLRDTPQEGNFRIYVSGLSAGVYYIRIGERVEKFVKM